MGRQRSQLARLCFVVKYAVAILAVSSFCLIYFLSDDDELLFDKIVPPVDIRAVDIELGMQDIPENRDKMELKDALVLMEDGRHLYEQKQIALPSCPPDVKINSDNRILDTVKYCTSIDWNQSRLPPELVVWNYTRNYECEGKLTTFDRDAALLLDVIVDKAFCAGRPCHENVDSFLGSGFRKTDKLELDEGFFLVPCIRLLRKNTIFFRGGGMNHLAQWVNALGTYPYPQDVIVKEIVTTFTIAIKRYEYWNLYHTMSDVYNAYMATRYFNISTDHVAVIFIDGGGSGPFLSFWETLFGKVSHLHQVSEQALYRQLFWNKLGYNSELLAHSNDALPLVEHFQKFVLDKFRLDASKGLNCKSLSILVISRQNYDNRTISRKLSNQEELVQAMKEKHTEAKILVSELETLSLESQLRMISNTDILIGVHGAGLTHALFLPAHAGVVEFLPDWHLSDGHFRGISRWRNLKYVSWRSPKHDNGTIPDKLITVPVDVCLKLVSDMISKICS